MLLAIDTSTRQIGVALYDGHRVLNEMTWTSPFHHTVELAPAVSLSLERAELDPEDVQAVGVATGPGSFTALRTGLAFAKGMALVQDLPLIGIPSLDIAAASLPKTAGPLCVVLEAGRKRFAAGWYRLQEGAWHPDGEPELLTASGLSQKIVRPTHIGGELNQEARAVLGQNPLARLFSPAESLRRPGVLAEMAWEHWEAGRIQPLERISPLYLTDDGLVT